MPSFEDNKNDDDNNKKSFSGQNESELEAGIIPSNQDEEESNTPVIVGNASSGGTVELQMQEEEGDSDIKNEDAGSNNRQSSASYVRQYSAELRDNSESRGNGGLHHDIEQGDSSHLLGCGSSHDGMMSISSLYSGGLDDDSRFSEPDLGMESATRGGILEDNEASDCLAPLPQISTNHSRMSSRTGDGFSSAGSLVRSDSKSTLMRGSIRVSVTHGIDADGKGDGFRAQSAQIRNIEDRLPHCRKRRGMNRTMAKVVNPFFNPEQQQEQHVPLDKKGNPIPNSSSATTVQYRITSIDTMVSEENGKINLGNFGLSGIYDDDEAGFKAHSTHSCWRYLKPNQMVVSYLFWAFRSSFMAVLLSAAGMFTSFTFIFALCIYLIGLARPSCIHVNGSDFGESSGWFANLMDAYSLSWTTFSTVGYGLIFPATSATAGEAHKCFGIMIFSTLEAFVGILFASFWGAIFLSKVTRVSSFAQVTFSDALVLRFGSGVGMDKGAIEAEEERKEEEEASVSNSADDDKVLLEPEAPAAAPKKLFVRSKLPCPVLEFRVLNRLAGQKHGEIIDASMNIVASIDEDQLISSDGVIRKKKKKRRKKKGARSAGRGVKDYLDDEEIDEDAAEQAEKMLKNILGADAKRKRRTVILNDDPTGNIMSRKLLAKLEIESQEHPFFKRIWNARHILDQDSPLLNQDTKNLILLNGGHWPKELDTAEKIRKTMHFDNIMVSLSGTSNADCNSVYAQKVYDYVDVCVGYQFCNLLYRDQDGVLSVDPDLLNDVTEQHGGGGEDLHAREAASASNIFIL